jgi:hypothetical protein
MILEALVECKGESKCKQADVWGNEIFLHQDPVLANMCMILRSIRMKRGWLWGGVHK